MNAGIVGVLGPHDLNTDGQSIARKAGRCHRRRQIHVARITRPEQLGRRGLRRTVDHDHALPTLAFLVMRESRGRCNRT